MNILFFSWEYPPLGAGVGRYVAEMAAALSAAGHKVTVATSIVDGMPEFEEDNGVDVLRCFRHEAAADAATCDLILRLAKERKTDFIETPEQFGFAADLLSRTGRPPVIVKMHCNDVLYAPRYAQAVYGWQYLTVSAACIRARDRIHAERVCIKKADILMAPCRRIIEEAQLQGLKYPSAEVVPNPYRPPAGWVNQPAAHPTVLFVGRLDGGKGIQYLPRLAESLRCWRADAVLEIAGGDSYARFLGSMKGWLQRQSGKAVDNMRFLGKLDVAKLDEAYRRAWLVVVPSKWDTFPTVVLESMGRGKAVVGSTNGGIPEMLENTSCPAVDPASGRFDRAVIELLSNNAASDAAAKSALCKCREEYSPAVVVERYINAVRRL